jgi:hypothetical protein
MLLVIALKNTITELFLDEPLSILKVSSLSMDVFYAVLQIMKKIISTNFSVGSLA